MGFFDDIEEERPRRGRRGIGDSDRLDWQGMVEETDEPEETEPEVDEDDDLVHELELDERGTFRRRSSRDEIDLWEHEDEE